MRVALPSCHLAPKDTLGIFPVLDSREAKLNEIQIWHRLMEIIFLLCFRAVNLPVTSAALFSGLAPFFLPYFMDISVLEPVISRKCFYLTAETSVGGREVRGSEL